MSGKVIPFSRFNRPHTIPHPVGDGTAPIFEEVYEDGKRVLKETGRQNLNEFVQASLDETKIYNIINRYMRGDESVLNRVNGQFIDVVGMPTNLAEAKQALINIENRFNELPGDVKSVFNNSVDEFVQAVSYGTLDKKLAPFRVDPPAPVKEDESVEK